MQPAELVTRPSTASDRVSRLPPEMRAGQPSIEAAAIRWVTPGLRRANPGLAQDERFSCWPATRSRGDASVGTEPDTSLATGARTAPRTLRQSSDRVRKMGGKAPAFPYFIGFSVISGHVRSTEILRRFHGVF